MGGRFTLRSWATMTARPTFYYDLASPYAYLAAERVNGLFAESGAVAPEWQPILLGGLFKRFDRESWGIGPAREEGMRECERRGAAPRVAPLPRPRPRARPPPAAGGAAAVAAQRGKNGPLSLG